MNDRSPNRCHGPLIRAKGSEIGPNDTGSFSPHGPKIKILTMEDDDIIRRSMAAYLVDRGYTVLEAPNGRLGLEIFRAEKPDLMLVDLRMPEVDGMQVLEAATRESPNTPIVVVSGVNATAHAIEALHLGAWDYLLKPIEDMAILLHAIETSLQRAWLIEENRRYQEYLEESVRKRTAELEKTNVALNAEIAERKRIQAEREKLIEKLESQNSELERFAYTVSHDLKSPLITIKGFLGVLEQDLDAHLGGHCAGEISEHMTRIGAAADRMFSFLEDLLELSRVGRLVNSPSDIQMGELAGEAVDLVGGPITASNIQVCVDQNLPVMRGDRVRLREVYQNLIENAVKYMGDQPDPKIEIGMRRGKGEAAVFFVRDNGIGIDPRSQEEIFGLFDKLDPASEGTGVGLSLARRILEVHGGHIWVESEGDGAGSTFCFTLASPK